MIIKLLKEQKESWDTSEEPTYLLHKDVALPKEIAKRCRGLQRALKDNMYLSDHIRDHFEEDVCRYGYKEKDIIEFLNRACENPIDPFEVRVAVRSDGAVYVRKYCIRGEYKDGNDLACVLYPEYNHGVLRPRQEVRTAWVNDEDDIHATLDTAKYNTAEDIKGLNLKRVI